MLRLTKKGKKLVKRNGGILKIQTLESGYYDYSKFDSWDSVYAVWAEELGGWGYYENIEKPNGEFFTRAESVIKMKNDFKKAMYETSLDECLENADMYGIARQFGYLVEED